jgi:hypothetical protein
MKVKQLKKIILLVLLIAAVGADVKVPSTLQGGVSGFFSM